jgi:acyl-CoA thioesterase-1
MLLNKILKYNFYFFIFLQINSCGNSFSLEETEPELVNEIVKILSLGDSYTIGQSVCDNCKFPSQLVDSIKNKNTFLEIDLKVIATTGWTTTNLITNIINQNLTSEYDLGTLLIGVNNQFQKKPFSLFEQEFPFLVDIAINSLNGNKNRLIVVSIPDYAFTPFGQGNTTITTELETYNNYIKDYCSSRGITFVNITDITQEGLNNTELVASDGLHPSTIAYSKFVERILPFALSKLGLD